MQRGELFKSFVNVEILPLWEIVFIHMLIHHTLQRNTLPEYRDTCGEILIMFNMNKIKNEGGSYGQILCGDSVNECELWKCRSCGWGEIINSAADATNTTSELFTTQTIQTKFT